MKVKIRMCIENPLGGKQTEMINGPVSLLGILSKVPPGWLRIPAWLNVHFNDDKEGLNGV
jgi:hypothetical protein